MTSELKGLMDTLLIINEKIENHKAEIKYLSSYLIHTVTPADDIILEEKYHEKCIEDLQNLYDITMKKINEKSENNPLHLI